MQHRNVLSLFRILAGTCATMVTLALMSPVHAESDHAFPLLSMATEVSIQPTEVAAEEALAVHEVRSAPQIAQTIDLTTKPENLWERIRNGFAMPNLNDDLVLYYQQWYQNRPDALRRMVERSRPYLYHIVDELEARGMPTELALLPMVESSFNPMAYSRSHASGLWQFIPATGKRFNLEQSWWQDERRDVVASTGAALEYLRTIYEMHGDWQLALASYNWGEGAVKRAIEKNEAKGLPTDFLHLKMPTETRHYVPKLQALKNIFSNRALMASLDIPDLPNEPYFATMETPHLIDVKLAARLANMSVDEFVALNPSFNRPVIKADTPVILPADKMETFKNNLENHKEPLTRWEAYTLRQGEKLDRIAARFGITYTDLLRVNGLSSKNRLAAGSTVLVPAGEGAIDLENLQDMDREPRIIEMRPEPRTRAVSRAKRGGKSTASASRSKSSGKASVAIRKAKPSSKVARSGNGRRS